MKYNKLMLGLIFGFSMSILNADVDTVDFWKKAHTLFAHKYGENSPYTQHALTNLNRVETLHGIKHRAAKAMPSHARTVRSSEPAHTATATHKTAGTYHRPVSNKTGNSSTETKKKLSKKAKAYKS